MVAACLALLQRKAEMELEVSQLSVVLHQMKICAILISTTLADHLKIRACNLVFILSLLGIVVGWWISKN